MNPLIQAWIKAALVWIMTYVATWLVTHHVLTSISDSVRGQIDAMSSLLITYAYSQWVKWKDRQKIVTASATGHVQTEQMLEQKIKSGESAPASTPKDELPTITPPTPPTPTTP